MPLINFGGVKENVVTRNEFPMKKAKKILRNETIAIIGYGVQGPAQALNLKDNGFKVIIGQSKQFPRDWDRARRDGWVPGKTLFDIEEAVRRGTIIQMLVSDAAQKQIWPMVKQNLKPGAALYFSHGFSIVFGDQTKVIPPRNVDVIMVAPKGSGTSVRRNFLPAPASIPVLPFSRMPPGAPRTGALPSASASGPGTCSRPRLSTRWSATLPASVVS